jgi:hypothetical protein
VAPILNANLGIDLPIDKHWIAYGLAMLLAGVLMRWALYGFLENRADICSKKDIPEKD